MKINVAFEVGTDNLNEALDTLVKWVIIQQRVEESLNGVIVKPLYVDSILLHSPAYLKYKEDKDKT